VVTYILDRMTVHPVGGTRGRPRDLGVDDRIIRAAVDELADVGVTAFSLNSVAQRARVAKRSIYSRWPDREGLITAGLASLSVGLAPPRTGTLDGDLHALFDQIADVLSEPRRSVLTRCSAELAAYPEVYAVFKRDVVDQSMAVIEDALVDARARGEIRSDGQLALVAEVFVSAIFGRSTYAEHTRPGGVPEMKRGLIALTLDALGR